MAHPPAKNDTIALLKNKHNAYCVLIVLFVYALVWSLIPTVDFQPHGIVYSYLDKPFKSVPGDAVKIYDALPYGSRVIGALSSEFSTLARVKDQNAIIINYAKSLAGRVGGNGLIIRIAPTQDAKLFLEGIVILAN